MSVYDWIEAYVPGGHHVQLGALLDAAYNEEYGAETRDQASLNLIYLLGFQPSPKAFEIFGVSDERFHIDGGNQQLPEAIANHLGRQTIKPGLGDEVDLGQRGRHRVDELLDARQDEDRHRRPRHSLHELRRAPHARHERRALRLA